MNCKGDSVGNANPSVESLLFQCQPSPEKLGLYYIPNIPDSYLKQTGDNENEDESTISTTKDKSIYIFTIPPKSDVRNCSGTLVSIKFCYEAKRKYFGKNIEIFTLVSLNKNGFIFEVIHRIPITTTPMKSVCTEMDNLSDYMCCDIKQLLMPQFQLNISSFTYGIFLQDYKLLQLISELRDHHYQQYQVPLRTLPTTFTSEQDDLKNEESLILLKFFLGL